MRGSEKLKKLYSLSLIIVLTFALYSIGEINSVKSDISSLNTQLSKIEQEQAEINNKLDTLSDELQQAQASTEQSKVDLTYKRDIPLSDDLQRFTYDLCNQYGVDYDLVLSIMREESQYTAGAISKTGDYGLMQINEINFDWLSALGLSDMLDSKQNTTAGVIILSNLQGEFDTTEGQLMAYNLGSSKARKYLAKGITSTNYTQKILGGN